MKQLFDASVAKGAECMYSDTDMIFIRKHDFGKTSNFLLNDRMLPVIGLEIGQLELECEFCKFMCTDKK